VSIYVKDLYYRPSDKSKWLLKGINLEVDKGEIVVIAGPSGSGKTMLLNVISGVAESILGGEIKGEVKIDISNNSNRKEKPRIGFLPQSFENHLLSFSVRDELLISALNSGYENHKKKLTEVINKLNLNGIIDRYVFNLSYGEMQRVALATIILLNYDLILLDEPLAQLDKWSTRSLLKVIKMLSEEEKTIIIAEHRLQNFSQLAGKFVLLNNGEKILEGDYSEIRPVAEKLGLRTSLKKNSLEFKKSISNSDFVLKASEIDFSWVPNDYVLRNVNVEILPGEIQIIYGHNGSGKTTLAYILAGYLKGYKGRILRKGKVLYVPQNPDNFLMYDEVYQEIYMPLRNSGLRSDIARETALALLSKFRLLEKASLDPFILSKGEKYRLAVASAISSGADLVILDEPTYGQDYRNLIEILDLLNQYVAESNKSVLLLTCDFDFYSSLSGKKFVLDKGSLRFDS